jgi:glycosyltransferase involved in cell wall biosynthesis
VKIFVHDYAGHPFQAELSRELARRGHEVVHLYFQGDPGPKGRLTAFPADPVNLSFVGVNLARPYDKASFVRRRFDDVAYGKAVARYLVSGKPDIVISGNTPTEAQSSILKACKGIGSAFVFWVQDFYSVAVTRLLHKTLGPIGAIIGAYYSFLERRQFRQSDAIVVITSAFADLAEKWGGDSKKVFTIENWGALHEISPECKDNEWARRHSLDNSFNFLYSGTLALKHNPTLLVELAKEVRGRANVVVVSQGVGTTVLERAKRDQNIDNLMLLPLQPVSDLSMVLATSDVAVATIEPEAGTFSVPSKVQSYFCAGRPVLLAAPHHNLAAEAVIKSEAGLVVRPTDKSGFLNAALRLLEDDKLRVASGRNAYEFALAHYEIKGVAERFETVFRHAIDTRNLGKEM